MQRIKSNKKANRFSVGTNDLSKGLTAAGAAMSTYGNDFNQTIALLTAGTEIMTGKSLTMWVLVKMF